MKVNPKVLTISNLPFISKFRLVEDEDLTRRVNRTRMKILRNILDRVDTTCVTKPSSDSKYVSHDVTVYTSNANDPNIVSLQGDFLFIYGTVDFMKTQTELLLEICDFYKHLVVDNGDHQKLHFQSLFEYETEVACLYMQHILFALEDGLHLNTVLYKFSTMFGAHYSKRTVGDDIYAVGALLPENTKATPYADRNTYDVEWGQEILSIKVNDVKLFKIARTKPKKEG